MTVAETERVSGYVQRIVYNSDEFYVLAFFIEDEPGRLNVEDVGLEMGRVERNISANIVHGLDEAKQRGLGIFGIVGRDGGYTKKIGDAVLVVPTVDPDHVTPLTEAFQAVAWHCMVSHPDLQTMSTKW